MDESKEYIDEMTQDDLTLPVCITKHRSRVEAKKVLNLRKSRFMSRRGLKYFNRARSIPWHAVFVFLVPILLGVLQVEYQNKKESPFETHPLQKHMFLTTICIYGALLGINKTQKINLISYGLLLSGAFSSLSLLSILLPQQLLWIVIIIWGSMPVILARRLLKSSVLWIINMLAKLTWGGACNNSPASPRVNGA